MSKISFTNIDNDRTISLEISDNVSAIPIDYVENESAITECFGCCCPDCSSIDISGLQGKINFPLEGLYDIKCHHCNPISNLSKPRKRSGRKKKNRKKNILPDVVVTVDNDKSNSDNTEFITNSVSTSDLRGFRGDTDSLRLKIPKKSPNKTRKLCVSINNLQNSSIDTSRSQSYQNLCERMKSSSLTDVMFVNNNAPINISDHDRLILERMSMKNMKELQLIENATIARQYWELEKQERTKMRNRQKEQYMNLIAKKRFFEQNEFSKRKKMIDDKTRDHCTRLRDELKIKSAKAKNQLKRLKMNRQIAECEKRNQEFQKMEAILSNYEENRLDEEIWRESLFNRIDQRIKHADLVRNKNLNVYKDRIRTDNEIHQQIHAANYDKKKREEIIKRQHLRERIDDRDRKFRSFAQQKQKTIENSQIQAKTSAILRDLVRGSFNKGDTLKIPMYAGYGPRSSDNGRISNMSQNTLMSHIQLS